MSRLCVLLPEHMHICWLFDCPLCAPWLCIIPLVFTPTLVLYKWLSKVNILTSHLQAANHSQIVDGFSHTEVIGSMFLLFQLDKFPAVEDTPQMIAIISNPYIAGKLQDSRRHWIGTNWKTVRGHEKLSGSTEGGFF